ncbi:MAG: putative Ig domain-containing protein [Terriglobales bacterium]
MKTSARAAAACALAALFGLAVLLAAAPPFQILTTYLPLPQAGKQYQAQLKAIGGQPPYRWAITQGRLPAGLSLNASSGKISGLPRRSGGFRLLVAVSDSSQPPLTERRLLPAGKGPPLVMQWTQTPQVAGQKLHGAIEVKNQSGGTLRLTVIAVAVNQQHKAFSLRYAHVKLDNGKSTGALPFATFLPPGTYTVHVDAVGAVSASVIYRQRLELPGFRIPGGL